MYLIKIKFNFYTALKFSPFGSCLTLSRRRIKINRCQYCVKLASKARGEKNLVSFPPTQYFLSLRLSHNRAPTKQDFAPAQHSAEPGASSHQQSTFCEDRLHREKRRGVFFKTLCSDNFLQT